MKYDILLAAAVLFIIVLIYLGYRYLPQKRIFYIFAVIVLISFGSAVLFSSRYLQKNNITEEQKTQILSEQPFFVTWYESYKQDVENIDHIWTQYNNTLDKFSQNEIDADTLADNLTKIQQDSDKLKADLETALPPQELSDANYRLSYDILEKTRQYLAAQNEAVKASVQVVGTPEFKEKPHDLQYKEIDNVRIMKSPVNLDVAADITSIRDNLILSDISGAN